MQMIVLKKQIDKECNLVVTKPNQYEIDDRLRRIFYTGMLYAP
jgi:hypothetical protein